MTTCHSTKSTKKLFVDYQHLAPTTLYRMLGQPYNVAKSKGLDYDDLLQYAHEGLWQACVTYNEKYSNFETHSINRIRWAVKNGLNRESNTFKFDVNNMPSKEEMYNLVGYDSPLKNDEEGLTVSETISVGFDLENEATGNFTVNEVLNTLNNREKTIVLYKLDGHTDGYIANKFNTAPQSINRTLRNIKNKIKKYKGELN